MEGNSQPAFRSLDQIEQLVHAFEASSLSPAEFDHRAHMAVAIWYLSRLPAHEAAGRMRDGLQRLLARHGLQGYNETITLFWMKLLRHYLDIAAPDVAPLDLTNQANAALGSMRYVFSHFSKQLVFSEEARRAWVEPDLLPLTF